MTTKIYGESDDLLEFDGTIYGEATAFDKPIMIKVTNGKNDIVFSFLYDNEGAWRFNCDDYSDGELASDFAWEIKRLPANWSDSMEDDYGYSDVVILPRAFTNAFSLEDGEWEEVQ